MFTIKAPSPTLCLTKFDVDRESKTLHISGRASGSFGCFGASPTRTFSLLLDRIELITSTLASESKKVFPLASIESAECGHRRSVGYLVAATILLVVGLPMLVLAEDREARLASLIPIAIGALCVVGFFSSTKNLFLAVYCGSQAMVLTFKPKASIGGDKIDRDTVMSTIEFLNDRIAEAQSKQD